MTPVAYRLGETEQKRRVEGISPRRDGRGQGEKKNALSIGESSPPSRRSTSRGHFRRCNDAKGQTGPGDGDEKILLKTFDKSEVQALAVLWEITR